MWLYIGILQDCDLTLLAALRIIAQIMLYNRIYLLRRSDVLAKAGD